MKTILQVFAFVFFSIFLLAGNGAECRGAALEKHGSSMRLMVDGKPFVILGGELGNSSASSPSDIERIFPQLRRMNLNTVLVPVYWDLLEPEEGKFDYSLLDKVIDTARENNLKVVLLWFGAWKNSMSCYAPEWFKADYAKYPRARTSNGKPMEIASAFSENVFKADSRAFEQMLRHVEAFDSDETVIMVQVENEIGMLEDARDYSAQAESEYAKGVPSELMEFLKKNKDSLHPQLLERWRGNGMKMSGGWKEVFGDDIYSDEYFMAWNYGRYVGRMAETARKVTSLPLYVNAAMDSRGRRPGEYPSAGPLARLKDIWHAAAPEVDILAPDLYDRGFTDWTVQYHTHDNPLFIPEIRRSAANGAQAFYVIGEHDALGISPFSIENGSDDASDPMVRAYGMLRGMLPLLAEHHGSGRMRGLYFDADSIEKVLTIDDITATASHFFTLPWDPRATDGSEWPAVGGLMICISPREYIVAGTGVVVKFEKSTEKSGTLRLGEDGFLDSGDSRGSGRAWEGGSRIGLASVDEVEVLADGSLRFVRRFSGDETHQGRHVRIGVDDFKILRVKLYEYK